jgi:hypothetical protein
MAHSLPHRLTLALVAGTAASALAAAPALATEGPAAPPPANTLPSGVAPVTFAPIPTPSLHRAARVISRARVVPRRVRRGRHARLKLSLTTPSRLRIVISRRAGRGRVHTATMTVPARGRTLSLRLPARSHGHRLRAARYRVNVVAIDAQGAKSQPVRVAMIVRR